MAFKVLNRKIVEQNEAHIIDNVLNRIYDSDINLIVYNHYCINTLHSRFDFMNNSTQLADYVAQRFFAAAGKAVA